MAVQQFGKPPKNDAIVGFCLIHILDSSPDSRQNLRIQDSLSCSLDEAENDIFILLVTGMHEPFLFFLNYKLPSPNSGTLYFIHNLEFKIWTK